MVFLLCWCFKLFIILLLLDTSLATDTKGDCIRPKKIKFAELSSGEMKETYRVGSTLTYSCLKGYEQIPGVIPQIMCSVSSEWIPDSPRFCQGKKCPSPDLENGKVITTADLRLGDRVTFACDHGYRLVGQKTSHCKLIGNRVKWDHLPACKRISCTSPSEIVNGRNIGLHKPSYGYGSKITFVCDHGFFLVGNETLTCRTASNKVDGSWDSHVPQCKEIHCPKPEIKNGNTDLIRPSFKHGQYLKVKCKNKFVLSGAHRIKCGGDKNWHPTLPTCVRGSAATGTGTGTGTRTHTRTGVTGATTTMPIGWSALPARSLRDHLNDIEEKVDKILRKVSQSGAQYANSEDNKATKSQDSRAAKSQDSRVENSEDSRADNSKDSGAANSEDGRADNSKDSRADNSEDSRADNSKDSGAANSEDSRADNSEANSAD